MSPLKVENFFSPDGGRGKSQKDRRHENVSMYLYHFENGGAPADSQQGNRNFRATDSRNWILPITSIHL